MNDIKLSDKWDEYFYIEVWKKSDSGEYFVSYLPYHIENTIDVQTFAEKLDNSFSGYKHIVKRRLPYV